MADIHSEPLDPAAYDSLGALLADALIQFKSDVALVENDRKRETRRITYRQFRDTGRALTTHLDGLGVGPGDRVAIIMSNQPSWLISAFAIFHRGATLIPVDYKLTAAEQRALLDHAKPKALITEYPIWRRLEQVEVPHILVTEVPDGRDADLRSVASRWEQAATPNPGAKIPVLVERKRSDDACIVYSSGTGGRPKGCVLTHGNYLAQLDALLALFPIVGGDRYFSILPTNHAIDFMCGFIGPLSGGATVVHQRTLRPEFLVETMKRQRITHMTVVPLILEAFERALKDKLDAQPSWKQQLVSGLSAINGFLTEKRANHALSSKLLKPIHDGFGGDLKMLICGGAFVDRQRAEYFYKLGLPVVIGYGLTECCTVATVNDLKPFRGDSVGRPVLGVDVKIDNPGPDGVGQVLIKGPTVMDRYLDDPDLTAETIIDGWLHTGDLGVMDAAHHLKLVGRSKNMIVTAGGKNIYPEDIEAAFESLEVEELCVFAENYVWPPGGRTNAKTTKKDALTAERLIAVLRVRVDDDHDKTAGTATVVPQLAALNRRLVDYKRVDGYIVVDDDFPRTASMKVKRNALAEMLREHVDPSSVTLLQA
ncbi:MAG: long-chain acyl-CoA synthetase [Myxococcota bacterium]|jgi:long-chain acyl-CoA synthetase